MKRRTVLLAGLGNLFSAFCGGAVLSSFIERHETRSVDVIFTYILGAAISLLVLRTAGSLVRRRLPILSILASATFLLLGTAGKQGNVVSSGIVSLLFGLLFIPRTLRTETVGEATKSLPIVEFAYSAGYLIAFLLPPISSERLLTMVGVSLSLVVCVLDAFLLGDIRQVTIRDRKEDALDARDFSIVLRFCGLTVGCQLVLQTLASEFRTTFPLIGFELGTTVAPLAYALLTGRFIRAKNTGISALLFSAVSGLALSASAGAPLVVIIATAAAFSYELVAIGLLQSLAHKHGAIARAFAINAVASSVIYWLWPAHYTLLAIGSAMTCASLLPTALLPLHARYLHARGD